MNTPQFCVIYLLNSLMTSWLWPVSDWKSCPYQAGKAYVIRETTVAWEIMDKQFCRNTLVLQTTVDRENNMPLDKLCNEIATLGKKWRSVHSVKSGAVYQPLSAVCGLPFTANPSVYIAALRGGCCVSRPAWWMLIVLDCAVCLQSNKRRLLLLYYPCTIKFRFCDYI